MVIERALLRDRASCLTVSVALVMLAPFLAGGAVAQAADSCVLAGKVVEADTGKPLESVKFLLFTRNLDSRSSRTQIITSGAKGAFSLTVEPNTDAIAVWQNELNPDYLFDVEWLRRTGNAVIKLGVIRKDKKDVVLKTKVREVCKLTGTVAASDGKPARNAMVYYRSRMQPVSTDHTGAFVLKAVPADEDYEVYITSADRKSSKIVKVKAGTKEAKIALTPAFDMKGKAIADDNKPAKGLSFWMLPVVNNEPLRLVMGENSCRTGSDGTFVAKNLCQNATYTAYWYSGGGMNAGYHEGNVKVEAAKGRTITLRVKRFIDDWDAAGNICISEETKCQQLTNYCLDANDNILACDGRGNVIRVISPEDKLLATWQLDFGPQAIECRDDGTVVVAGSGKIALLDKNGKVIRQAKLPGSTATGVGWSGDDVFVSARDGRGYSIYRMNSQLTGQERIIKGLRGCCGQMDFTVKDGVIYVAANCEFKVMKYDRHGKRIGSFGRRARGGDEGFDGCCEPKNVCFDRKGNLYTAESGKCCVKKFSPEGKYLGPMGKVATIRGCVRVTIALPKDCSKIYMLDTGRNIIRIVPPPEKGKRG